MTYNTGAKKQRKYCPECFAEISKRLWCSSCNKIIAECDALTETEVKNLK
jgi:hypothetical protein